jgi:hypothetical protein
VHTGTPRARCRAPARERLALGSTEQRNPKQIRAPRPGLTTASGLVMLRYVQQHDKPDGSETAERLRRLRANSWTSAHTFIDQLHRGSVDRPAQRTVRRSTRATVGRRACRAATSSKATGLGPAEWPAEHWLPLAAGTGGGDATTRDGVSAPWRTSRPSSTRRPARRSKPILLLRRTALVRALPEGGRSPPSGPVASRPAGAALRPPAGRASKGLLRILRAPFAGRQPLLASQSHRPRPGLSPSPLCPVGEVIRYGHPGRLRACDDPAQRRLARLPRVHRAGSARP